MAMDDYDVNAMKDGFTDVRNELLIMRLLMTVQVKLIHTIVSGLISAVPQSAQRALAERQLAEWEKDIADAIK